MSPLVLIVDDDEDMRAACAELLQTREFRVATARDGAEGLEKVRRLHPDVVLLDLHMPVVDGFGVLRALAATPAARPTVLVYSSQGDARTIAEARALGAVDCLAKPLSAEALVARIRSAASTV
jgi:DNA-binding response OmpR family regulator